MTKEQKRNEITRLVASIHSVKAEIQAKKDSVIEKKHGFTDETRERDVWNMKERVNKLAGLKIF